MRCGPQSAQKCQGILAKSSGTERTGSYGRCCKRYCPTLTQCVSNLSLHLVSQDLRAVLKLQPSNTEAIAELDQLAPPNPAPKTQQPGSTWVNRGELPSSSAASSSSNRIPSVPTGSGSRSAFLRKKAPQPLPFARTFMDDRKLKISTLPMTIDVPIDLPSLEPLPKSGKDKGKRPSIPPLSSIRTQPETFIYPSWERYAVKRVPD